MVTSVRTPFHPKISLWRGDCPLYGYWGLYIYFSLPYNQILHNETVFFSSEYDANFFYISRYWNLSFLLQCKWFFLRIRCQFFFTSPVAETCHICLARYNKHISTCICVHRWNARIFRALIAGFHFLASIFRGFYRNVNIFSAKSRIKNLCILWVINFEQRNIFTIF